MAEAKEIVITEDHAEDQRNLRSKVWEHFREVDGAVSCKYCDKGNYKIRHDGKYFGTSNLKYHLERNHLDLVGDLSCVSQNKGAVFKATHCLMRWVVASDQPFTVVESPSFKALLRSINPKNSSLAESLPQTAKILRENLMDSYESEAKKQFVACKGVSGQMSFTIDGWTSTNRIPFLGVTGHWVDDNFEIHNNLMGFIHFPVRHTGKNICDAFVSLVQKFDGKVLAVTMDNASNNDVFSVELEKMSVDLGIRYSSQTHIRCFAHVINLAVQALLKHLKSQASFDTVEEYLDHSIAEWKGSDCNVGNAVSKIRTVVTKIRLSGQREEQLSQLNLSFGVRDLKVILDVKTRWNSTYAMLCRAIYLKQSLQSMMLTDKEIRKFALNEPEWEILEKFKALLKDFDSATSIFSSVNYPTISMVMPAYHWLLDKLNTPTLDPFLEEACSLATDKLKAYQELSNIEGVWVAIANYGKTEVKTIKAMVLNVFNTYYENSSVTSTSSPTIDNAGVYAFYPKRPVKLAHGSELLKYFKDDLQPPKTNVLRWWRDNQHSYPTVAKMAKDYLAIPAASVSAERAFSVGTDLITHKRGSLQADTVSAMMSLKLWWKGVNENESYDSSSNV